MSFQYFFFSNFLWQNPERLKQVGWLEKLENATARLGATFVDYQAETGTWIFTVSVVEYQVVFLSLLNN